MEQTEFQRIDLAAAKAEGRRTVVLGVVQQKGGVGKTMTAVNLAAALVRQIPAAKRDRKYEPRVLLVDLDPQASATEWLGAKYLGDTAWLADMPAFFDSQERWAPPSDLIAGLPQVFKFGLDDAGVFQALQDALLPVPQFDGRLWLLGTGLEQQVVERQWIEEFARQPQPHKPAHHFASRLALLDGAFDAIVFDASPGLSEATDALHMLSQQLILPVGPNSPSLVALLRTRDAMLEVVERERSEYGREERARDIHIILNGLFASRTLHGEEFQSLLETAFGTDFVTQPLKYAVDLTLIANVQPDIGRGHTVFEAGSQTERAQQFFKDLAARVLLRATQRGEFS